MKTFEEAFYEFHRLLSPSISPLRRYGLVNQYENRIHPFIGDLLLSEIDHHIAVQPIRKLEMEGKTRSSNQVRQLIERVFDYAFYVGYCNHNPVYILKKVTKRHTQVSYPFLNTIYMPDFFIEMKKKTTIDKCHWVALLVIVLTAARSGEVFGMRWCEIDFKTKEWNIPPFRMKTRIAHSIMLSEQLIDLLKRWKEVCTSDFYVFPSRYKNKDYITGSRIRNSILLTKYANKQTLHGFRHVFSTTCYESNLWREDAIELCIAHNSMTRDYHGSKRFYNHARYKKEKQQIMQWYADIVEGWLFPADNEIISIDD